VHPDTIGRGVGEMEGNPQPQTRVRPAGGGRKQLAETDPALASELKALVPQTRGDPMSLLVWTTKSTRNLAGTLTGQGHTISERTVARMLRAMGFSLQGNAKVTEGRQHQDRDAQFTYLAGQVAEHIGKIELAQFATDTGLSVTVTHLPPGTSKWNKSNTGSSPSSP